MEGTPPEVGGKLSSCGVDAARLVLDRGRFIFGVAVSSFFALATSFLLGVAASTFSTGVGTPVGRIASGCNVWPKALMRMAKAQNPKHQPRANFMGEKLATTFSTVQAHRFAAPLGRADLQVERTLGAGDK